MMLLWLHFWVIVYGLPHGSKSMMSRVFVTHLDVDEGGVDEVFETSGCVGRDHELLAGVNGIKLSKN